ncbi:alcohol oxidase [Auriculariales sp. MPI-PUGE-AT-0066]|nr:alcohol oxidase [Auriculariales sp. MPI-PUGE-AT-0066]
MALHALRTFTAALAIAQLGGAVAYDASWLVAREITPAELRPSYDFVIVGGGQSGLVIANRLTEDPTKTVLVVEYGVVDRNPAQLQPSSAANYPPALLYNITSVVMPTFGNRSSIVFAAATAGGGSTVNSMNLDRAAPMDYDAWALFSRRDWSFSGLLPYFRKSTQLTPPDPELAEEFGITYDLKAYGKKSPVQLSYASYQWPGTKIQYKAMLEAGVKPNKEQGLGAYGVVWFPSALDPVNVTRSYAVNRYYDPASSRSNLHLLTYSRVNEIIFNKRKHATGVTVQPRDTTTILNVTAKKEIVLTAGALHTPQILQRSGVGPAALLKEAKVPVVVDLPGVGSNYQDHSATSVANTFATDVVPNPGSLLTNETFIAWADELWAANRTGPRSITVWMVGGWLPLRDVTPTDYQELAAALKAQDPAAYLPSTYTPEQVRGFELQRDTIVASYLSDKAAQIELPFGGAPEYVLSLEHPLSRGTVALNTTHIYSEPIIDFRTFSNPIDPLVLAKAIKFVRRWTATPSYQTLTPTESVPGAALQTNDELIAWIRTSGWATVAHNCCTAALSPRSLGGVVDADLLVHGVTGLSIGDASVMPMIPATHTCATVYAIAEKAADLIKARHHFRTGSEQDS